MRLHVNGASFLYRHTLSALEARLEPPFARTHRSTIVNLNRLAALRRKPSGSYEMTLAGGVRLTIARRYRERVFAMLRRSFK